MALFILCFNFTFFVLKGLVEMYTHGSSSERVVCLIKKYFSDTFPEKTLDR